MKASELLVRCLEKEQIEYVFGVPGEENADFLLSLDASPSIRFLLTRHEQSAAFMADIYGRLTGNPAVALGTLGPGATNLVTGVANATMDRSPMLVLTAQGDLQSQHKESHQIIDVVAMYQPITKWANSIKHPNDIPEVVRKAVRVCRSEKPGAVHIELSEEIAGQEATGEPLQPRRFRRPRPDDKSVDQAFELLRASRRPVIIAGNGTIRRRASCELRRLCEKTGIGVISTFMGKGCVDRDADYCLFTIGLQQHDQLTQHVADSDLAITIGYDMAEYPPRLWNFQLEKTNIHIDFAPAEIDAYYHPEVELIGDVAHALELLNQRAEVLGAPEIDRARQQRTRQMMLDDFAEHKDDDTEGKIRPQKVLWDLREELAPPDILLCGVGAHKMWVGRYWHCHEPNTCLISNGFCAMGMPLPGAIAAHLVHPDRHIFALTGDGDFLMNVHEMETARRLDSDITVMVWEDHDYGLITWKQDTEFGRHIDMTFGNPKWPALADAFGWQYQVVERSRDLRPAIRTALDHRGPSLLVVPIDYRENKLLTQRLGQIVCRL
ncbi:MAG: acetolactate synthase large subunit [Gammaproteobacteria bacterium]